LISYKNLYKGKTVLITGHTGFKGSWLASWLKILGANVIGIALSPSTQPSHYACIQLSNEINDLRVDIRDKDALEAAILSAEPDFIFHLAAQALIKKSYENPLETWHTNLIGTLNILETIRKLNKPCAAVLITSDKCYENVEWVWGYRETDAMGGIDPYSASKGAAELAIHSHIRSFFPKENTKVRIASARAGNVIGGGDWSESRIVPDCVKSWAIGDKVKLRNPNSTRPWQHVLEPLSGYLSLALNLYLDDSLHGESFNFGPQSNSNFSVLNLAQEMSKHWDKVSWVDESHLNINQYEAGLLKLNCDKALHYLNWRSILSFNETVKITAEWYKAYYLNPEQIYKITQTQIYEYMTIAEENNTLKFSDT
jgi:CDP-glucose 4,6-dehydratase